MSKKFEELKKTAISADPSKGWQKSVKDVLEGKPWRKDMVILAIKISAALKRKRLTQKQAAALLEISPQAFNKIMKGRQNMTIGTIRKIEQALDISLISLKHQDKKPAVVMQLQAIKTNYKAKGLKVFSGNIKSLKNSGSKKATETLVRDLTRSA